MFSKSLQGIYVFARRVLFLTKQSSIGKEIASGEKQERPRNDMLSK